MSTASAVGPPPTGPRQLAAPQLAILAAEGWADELGAYTVVSAVRIAGPVAADDLAAAGRTTLERHDVLTWRIGLDPDSSLVAFGGADTAAVEIVQVDFTDRPAAVALAAARDLLATERRRPLAVVDSTEPRVRLLIARLPAGRHEVEHIGVLVVHHALVDEFSTQLIWTEILRRAGGVDVTGGYDARYAEWAAQDATAAAGAAAQEAARDLLAALDTPGLTAPSLRQVRPGSAGPAATHQFTLPAELCADAEATARRLNVAQSAPYGAAAVRALARFTRGEPFTLRLPVSRRPAAAYDVVGCFVTSLPIRVGGDAATAAQAVYGWQDAVAIATAHAHADLAVVQAGLGGLAGLAVSFERRVFARSGPLRWRTLPPPHGPAKAALTLSVAPGSVDRPGDARLVWRPGTCEPGAVRQVATQYVAQLRDLIAGIG